MEDGRDWYALALDDVMHASARPILENADFLCSLAVFFSGRRPEVVWILHWKCVFWADSMAVRRGLVHVKFGVPTRLPHIPVHNGTRRS